MPLNGKQIEHAGRLSWRVMGEAVNGPGGYFGRNLDAFADCLRGGFGTPDDHYTSRSHGTTTRLPGHTWAIPRLLDELQSPARKVPSVRTGHRAAERLGRRSGWPGAHSVRLASSRSF